MEYVIVHRGGRGQTFTYELVYAGNGEHGEAFISGLITPNLSNGANLAGVNEELAGSKRPQNGSKTGGSRSTKTPLQASDTVELIAKSVEKDLLEKNKKVPSGTSIPLSARV